MLRGRDIQTIAGKAKIRDTQIEKDYVLSWLLWGIAQSDVLYQNLIFKGGTVLKKAYFTDYRFSEDLDFTLINLDMTDEQIINSFGKTLELVSEESGMQFKLSAIDKHQSGSIAFYTYFIGPLGGKMDSKSVKIDITRGEKLLFKPRVCPIFKTYNDLPEQPFYLQCYPLEEIIVEKLVALMGRTQPRDLYDIWYLLEENVLELDFIKTEFPEKARHKGHQPESFLPTWQRKTKQFENLWNQYLAHQIADLPKFDGVCRALNRYFKVFA
ncbi:MAG: nucleotidyl transferase AbiEii/AbiGii toxin family protein [Saprospiraceae bacterium]|nr:nucleotidyl transferase AbiEii/AbiGii toxin family protein [Saprospiraceae bacterium]